MPQCPGSQNGFHQALKDAGRNLCTCEGNPWCLYTPMHFHCPAQTFTACTGLRTVQPSTSLWMVSSGLGFSATGTSPPGVSFYALQISEDSRSFWQLLLSLGLSKLGVCKSLIVLKHLSTGLGLGRVIWMRASGCNSAL